MRQSEAALQAANLALARTLDLDTLFETLLDCLQQLVSYDTASVMLLEGRTLSVSAARGFDEQQGPDVRSARFAIGANSILQHVIGGARALAIDDVRRHPGWEVRKGCGHIRGWLGAPLIAGGQAIGLFTLDKTVAGFFTADHVQLAEAVAAHAAVAIRNARLFAEREHAERRLAESEARLLQAQKLESVGRLAGGIAHDFNNLLTVIVGHSEMLASTFEQWDPRQEQAREILKAAERGAALTHQLLAFSRRQVLQPRVIDLNLVVSKMDTILRGVIGDAIDLVTRFDPALGAIRADPVQIEQVMMNLVVNARDAMPNGGRLEITTRNVPPLPETGHRASSVQADLVELVVADTGTGMTDGVLAHIFEPFFTTKEQGKGTGLGLATVYGIVQQSGGEIRVESAPGRGSTFTIHLPSHRASDLPGDGSPTTVTSA